MWPRECAKRYIWHLHKQSDWQRQSHKIRFMNIYFERWHNITRNTQCQWPPLALRNAIVPVECLKQHLHDYKYLSLRKSEYTWLNIVKSFNYYRHYHFNSRHGNLLAPLRLAMLPPFTVGIVGSRVTSQVDINENYVPLRLNPIFILSPS